jgi:hypothetical protein
MSCLYIYMYMRFEVVQTTCCLRVVHALNGNKDLFSSFLYGTLPIRDTPPRGYSRQPPPCSPLPPTALPGAGRCGRTRAGCQIPPVSLFNFPHSLSIPLWIYVRPPLPHSHTEDARPPAGTSSGGPACGFRSILLHEHVPVGGEHAQEQRGLHGGCRQVTPSGTPTARE